MLIAAFAVQNPRGGKLACRILPKLARHGKPYTVQYFERAVFEYHPENPLDKVLLSQLGIFRDEVEYPQALSN